MTGKPWQEQPRESGRFSFTSKKESDVDLPVESPAEAVVAQDAAPTATVAEAEAPAQPVATAAPSEPKTRAQYLADSADPAERAEAVDDPDLSPELLEQLTHDEDPVVRARVATSGHYGALPRLLGSRAGPHHARLGPRGRGRAAPAQRPPGPAREPSAVRQLTGFHPHHPAPPTKSTPSGAAFQRSTHDASMTE